MGPIKISASAIWAAAYAQTFCYDGFEGFDWDHLVLRAIDVANAAVRELSARAEQHGVEVIP